MKISSSTKTKSVETEKAGKKHIRNCTKSKRKKSGRKIEYVRSKSSAQKMVKQAIEMPLSHIGVSVIFDFETLNIPFGVQPLYNPTNIRPVAMSFIFAEKLDSEKLAHHKFVLDLRKPKVFPIIREIVSLPICFVGCNFKEIFFILWKLRAPEPKFVWDIMICEKAMCLGEYHEKYLSDENIYESPEDNQQSDDSYGSVGQLQNTCKRYNIPYPTNYDDDFEINSMLRFSQEKRFSKSQRALAIRDAQAASMLYPKQIVKASYNGILHHLINIEMPFIRVISRMEWVGARFDFDEAQKAIKYLDEIILKDGKKIVELGLYKPTGRKELERFFDQIGLLHLFKRHGKLAFKNELYEQYENKNPIFSPLLRFNKSKKIRSTIISFTKCVCEDNKLHPQYDQLGTQSGRLTSSIPNIISTPRKLRYLIVPGKDRAIGIADYAQFEIGIMAALSQDTNLIEMYNSTDIYVGIAKSVYRKNLSKKDLSLSDKNFKARHKDLRDNMKECTFIMVYGGGPASLAGRIGCTINEANKLFNKFEKQFYKLSDKILQIKETGLIKGQSTNITNLIRNRGKEEVDTEWEKRWMWNYQIQGSATAIFKAAGIRLDALYARYDAKIIVPVHDAFVFEAPIKKIEKVAKLTKRVMRDTFREFCPELKGKVDIEISNPGAWGTKKKI